MYTGNDGNSAETGLATSVVLQLTQHLEAEHHQIYFDNFFTSKYLLESLLERGFYGCGTARSNRKGFPDALKNIKMKTR